MTQLQDLVPELHMSEEIQKTMSKQEPAVYFLPAIGCGCNALRSCLELPAVVDYNLESWANKPMLFIRIFL